MEIVPELDTNVEEAAEVVLQLPIPLYRNAQTIVHGLTKGGDQSENSAYLDENGGAVEDLDIHKIVTSNEKPKTAVRSIEEITEVRSHNEMVVEEEEVVELEFEKAIPKLHTHTMYCPNCRSRITKVVLLRRKIIKPQRSPTPITQEQREPVDLLGCFSCFSLFTSAGKGRFNPFPLWTKPDSSGGAGEEEVSREDGNCFSVFRVFRKPNVNEPVQSNVGVISPAIGDVPSHLGGHQTSIDIPPAAAVEGQTERPLGQDSTSFEILKSIVYGGLMEVIASLSVVASVAATDAATLSIVAVALANVVGGIFIISNNLWDLRNDCYKISNQQTNGETRNKYKDLLGRVENFPLHVFFAMLSFLVFGIIPPAAYGYSFHETNDKDFTLMVVAGGSVICVGLLAICKAYIDRCSGFWGYVKTMLYYLVIAVSVSGVAYGTGDLVTMVTEKLGLFEMTPRVAMSLLSEVVSANPSLA